MWMEGRKWLHCHVKNDVGIRISYWCRGREIIKRMTLFAHHLAKMKVQLKHRI